MTVFFPLMWVRGHSKSSKLMSFESLGALGMLTRDKNTA